MRKIHFIYTALVIKLTKTKKLVAKSRYLIMLAKNPSMLTSSWELTVTKE